MVFLAVSSGAALVWLARNRLRDPRFWRVRLWRLLLPAAALLVWFTVGVVLSGQWWTTLLGAPGNSLGLVQAICLAVVGVACAYMRSSVRRVIDIIAPWMLLLQSLAVGFGVVTGSHVGGTTSNSTFLSQVFLVLLPFVLVGGLESWWAGDRRTAVWRSGVGVATLVMLGLSGSRVGLALGLAGVAVCWWVASGRAAAAPARARWLPSAAIAVTCALFALPVTLTTMLGEARFESSLLSRPYMWEAAIRLVSSSPLRGLVGSGPDGYRMAIAPVASTRMSVIEGSAQSTFGTLAADPHNGLMLVLAAGGAIGLSLVIWLTWEVVRNWSAQAAAGRADAAAVIAVGLYAGTTVLAPVPLQTAVLGAVVLGVSLLPERSPLPERAVPRGVVTTLGWTTWTLAVASSVLLAAHVLTRIAVGPIDQGSVTLERARRAEAAAEAWRIDPFLYFWAGRMWTFVGVEQGAIDAAERSRAACERATRLEPDNPIYARELALALNLFDGDRQEAIEHYDRAVELFPTWFECRLEYADYLLGIGAPEDALEHAVAATELGPGDPAAHEAAAAAHDGVGRPQEAAAYRAEALRLRAGAGSGP